MTTPRIANITLFISTTSANSNAVLNAFPKFPGNVVRLDTKASRERAKRGHVPITNVPTLVMVFDDGNVSSFVGMPKIVGVLQNLLNPPPTPQPSPTMDEPPKTKKKVRLPPPDFDNTGDAPPVRKFPPPDFDDNGTGNGDNDDDDNGEGNLYKNKKPKKKTKKNGKYKKMVTNNEEIEFLEEGIPSKPPGPPTSGLLTGAQSAREKSGMEDLKAKAREMQKQMMATYGYDEKDLPRN